MLSGYNPIISIHNFPCEPAPEGRAQPKGDVYQPSLKLCKTVDLNEERRERGLNAREGGVIDTINERDEDGIGEEEHAEAD